MTNETLSERFAAYLDQEDKFIVPRGRLSVAALIQILQTLPQRAVVMREDGEYNGSVSYVRTAVIDERAMSVVIK